MIDDGARPRRAPRSSATMAPASSIEFPPPFRVHRGGACLVPELVSDAGSPTGGVATDAQRCHDRVTTHRVHLGEASHENLPCVPIARRVCRELGTSARVDGADGEFDSMHR